MRRFPPWLFFLFALTALATQAQTLRSAEDNFRRGAARFAEKGLGGAIANAEKDFADSLASVKESQPALEERTRGAKLQCAQRLAGLDNDYEAGGKVR